MGTVYTYPQGGRFRMKIISQDVERAKLGDRQAFANLYGAVSLDLYKLALYTLNNVEDAEDVVSETFVEAYKGLKNLREVDSFRPWIFKILSIRCKRRIGKYVKEKGNIDLEDYVEEGVDGGENLKVEMQQALAKLTVEEREIVIMSAIHGYTMKEIAEIKNLPQGTVSSKLHRTLKKLRNLLAQ